MSENKEQIECLIIGSGPAGYTAAIYATRANLKTVLYQGMVPGGQLTMKTEVENFPGYPEGIQGFDMMEDFKKQAERFGTEVRGGIVSKVDLSGRPFKAVTDEGKELFAETLIIATGATARYLGLESEEKFSGSGVSACATCDGFFYKGLDVAVVGGGDTACEEAAFLSKLCNKVYLIHRRDELRATKAMQEKVFNLDNVEIIWEHVPKEITGDQTVKGAILENVKTKEEKKLDIQGFFIAIGHIPNSKIVEGQLELDELGYIITRPDSTKTSVSGVFVAGDVQDNVFRQAITAAGSGSMAAIEAERFLSEKHT